MYKLQSNYGLPEDTNLLMLDEQASDSNELQTLRRLTAVPIWSQSHSLPSEVALGRPHCWSVPVTAQELLSSVPVAAQELHSSVPVAAQKMHRSVPVTAQKLHSSVPVAAQFCANGCTKTAQLCAGGCK